MSFNWYGKPGPDGSSVLYQLRKMLLCFNDSLYVFVCMTLTVAVSAQANTDEFYLRRLEKCCD